MRAAVAVALLASLAGCDSLFGLQHLSDRDAANAGDDANPNDVMPDAPDGIYFQEVAYRSGEFVDALSLPITIPPGANQVMVVFVAVGVYCTDGTQPSTKSVSLVQNMPVPLGFVMGTPCQSQLSRSEVWLIKSPPTGTQGLAVVLTGTARSLHVSALVFAGVNLTDTFRGPQGKIGEGTSASVTMESAPGDMVVSFVGQGTNIFGPVPPATVRYLSNVNANTTLNNTAVATLDGASPDVTPTWTFPTSDQYQAIAISLKPAP